MKNNNEYLKKINRNLTGENIVGHHKDNYYLKRIELNTRSGMGSSYDDTELRNRITALENTIGDSIDYINE